MNYSKRLKNVKMQQNQFHYKLGLYVNFPQISFNAQNPNKLFYSHQTTTLHAFHGYADMLVLSVHHG